MARATTSYVDPSNQFDADTMRAIFDASARYHCSVQVAAGARPKHVDFDETRRHVVAEWLLHAIPAGNC